MIFVLFPFYCFRFCREEVISVRKALHGAIACFIWAMRNIKAVEKLILGFGTWFYEVWKYFLILGRNIQQHLVQAIMSLEVGSITFGFPVLQGHVI